MTSSPARGTARDNYFRAFARSLATANYLLGKRGTALVAGVNLSEPEGRRELAATQARLLNGPRERRARALAAEVARVVRAVRKRRIR